VCDNKTETETETELKLNVSRVYIFHFRYSFKISQFLATQQWFPIKCRFSVNRVSIRMSIEYRSRVSIKVLIDTRPQMLLVHMIQNKLGASQFYTFMIFLKHNFKFLWCYLQGFRRHLSQLTLLQYLTCVVLILNSHQFHFLIY